ncbi:hypothetical protein ACO2Q3_11975 [Caulobacter sp. KR2-114]|uniref:hypothetical protein n=1 Tax=Caulobacter sp. KR2-114 TaxID=3400912 RepID=UPI003C05C1D1
MIGRVTVVIGLALAASVWAAPLRAEAPSSGAAPAQAGPPAVISSLDLTGPFATRTPWRFVATQGPKVPDPNFDGETAPGAVSLCLARPSGGACVAPLPNLTDAYWNAHNLDDARIVRAGATPLLWLRTSSLPGANGDQAVLYQLLAYRRAADRFEPVYALQTGRNNNQDARFVTRGPLAGAVISAEPTPNAPFGFWVTVSRLSPGGGAFRPVLRYRSATRYGDGNPLAVIDSEMPNILQRLGLWLPGQPLPLPAGPCPKPRLVKGALWCG